MAVFLHALNIVLLITLLSACGQTDSPAPPPESSPTEAMSEERNQSPENITHSPKRLVLMKQISLLADESHTAVSTLRTRVEDFVRTPSENARKAALQAWQEAHELLQVWHWLRRLELYDPLLDESAVAPNLRHSIWSRLDQAPLIPGYLDEVAGYPASGLMHAETPINADAIAHEHQFSDPAYVALGFHALEFMLQGDPEIPGNTERARAFASLPNDTLDPLRSPPLRRSLYVLQLAQQIDQDMQTLSSAWLSEDGSYARQLRGLSHATFGQGFERLLEPLHPDAHLGVEGAQAIIRFQKALKPDHSMQPAAPAQESPSNTASQE